MKTSIRSFQIAFLFLVMLLQSCGNKEPIDASFLLNKVNESHQTSDLLGKKITFTFREYQYSLERTKDHYIYTRTKDSIQDVLDSREGYQRLLHGQPIKIADSMAVKYANSVNSVLYFFQLPYVLNDPAAQLEYLGETTIKDSAYYTLKVTFSREQGGEDYEDEFRYWIHAEKFELDYFAYSYKTDGGGIRFREAIDQKRIEGILFQDYINYKPSSLSVSLDSLPKLFETQQLQKVSEIVNTNIQVENR